MASEPENPRHRVADPGSQLAAESALIERFLQRIPEADRPAARAELEELMAFVRDADPAANPQRPLTASQLEAQRQFLAEREARIGGTAKLVRVTVALVPALESPTSRATVIRRPGDKGRPLLLLREADVTDQDLQAGLRAAAASHAASSDSPETEIRTSVRVARGGGQTLPTRSKSPLDLLKSAPVRDVAGVGMVRSMDIMVRERPKAR